MAREDGGTIHPFVFPLYFPRQEHGNPHPEFDGERSGPQECVGVRTRDIVRFPPSISSPRYCFGMLYRNAIP